MLERVTDVFNCDNGREGMGEKENDTRPTCCRHCKDLFSLLATVICVTIAIVSDSQIKILQTTFLFIPGTSEMIKYDNKGANFLKIHLKWSG